MRLLTIFGARFNAIKMMPLIRELHDANGASTFVCVTGQHQAMLDSTLEPSSVQSRHHLDAVRLDQALGYLVGWVKGRTWSCARFGPISGWSKRKRRRAPSPSPLFSIGCAPCCEV